MMIVIVMKLTETPVELELLWRRFLARSHLQKKLAPVSVRRPADAESPRGQQRGQSRRQELKGSGNSAKKQRSHDGKSSRLLRKWIHENYLRRDRRLDLAQRL